MAQVPRHKLVISTSALYWPRKADARQEIDWRVFGKGGPQDAQFNPDRPWKRTRRINNKHVKGTLTFTWTPDHANT